MREVNNEKIKSEEERARKVGKVRRSPRSGWCEGEEAGDPLLDDDFARVSA